MPCITDVPNNFRIVLLTWGELSFLWKYNLWINFSCLFVLLLPPGPKTTVLEFFFKVKSWYQCNAMLLWKAFIVAQDFLFGTLHWSSITQRGSWSNHRHYVIPGESREKTFFGTHVNLTLLNFWSCRRGDLRPLRPNSVTTNMWQQIECENGDVAAKNREGVFNDVLYQ